MAEGSGPADGSSAAEAVLGHLGARVKSSLRLKDDAAWQRLLDSEYRWAVNCGRQGSGAAARAAPTWPSHDARAAALQGRADELH